MTKRKSRRTPGWADQPVSWAYSVSFKKPRGKRLRWVITSSQDEVEASRQANDYMKEADPGGGFVEYGISPTYLRHWVGYDEYITKDEYEYALNVKDVPWHMREMFE